MPRHQLSELQVRRVKPPEKPRKMFDGGGLYLLIHPNGSRYWRLKYRHTGKERLLALGVYPEVSLADARERADDARRLVASGVDAVHDRRARRASSAAESAQTFRAIAEEWLATRAGVWSSSYGEGVRSALAFNLYPPIGSLPIRQITVPIMREALLPMEQRGTLVALVDKNVPSYPHGGGTIAYDGGREILAGAFSFKGPCPPSGQQHAYEWTVQALDSSGRAIATTTAAAKFPPR